MRFGNLVILGTSHIARQSLEEVKKSIENENPDVVALELDEPRLRGLLSRKVGRITLKDIRRVGLKGYIFSLIGGWAERKLGEKTGVKPGAEMLEAYRAARKNKKIVALIDQDISITLRKLSNSITWKEKWHFIADLFKGAVLRKKEICFDLSKVPSESTIKKMTSGVKKRYPNIYRVLVDERNTFMAGKIAELCTSYPEDKILAVIGAGHEKEIMEMVKKRLGQGISYSFTANA